MPDLSLEATVNDLIPGVVAFTPEGPAYNPRKGLAIYRLPPGKQTIPQLVLLAESLAARTMVGCAILDGIPKNVPEGAITLGIWKDLAAHHPHLIESQSPPPSRRGGYTLRFGRHSIITAHDVEGLGNGASTFSMILSRHGGSVIPGGVVTDYPLCDERGLTLELPSDDANQWSLSRFAAMACSFKANRIVLSIPDDFSGRLSPGVRNLIDAKADLGIGISIGVSWLGNMVNSPRPHMWTNLRRLADLFEADGAVLEDATPPETNGRRRKLLDFLMSGAAGLPLEIDANFLSEAQASVEDFTSVNIRGWLRPQSFVPGSKSSYSGIDMPLTLELPNPGYGVKGLSQFSQVMNAAERFTVARPNARSIRISLRHSFSGALLINQTLPIAAGLAIGWGNPPETMTAANRLSSLMYGAAGQDVLGVWEDIAGAFPSFGENKGLSGEHVLDLAFGTWPREEDLRLLADVDWPSFDKKRLSAQKDLDRLIDTTTGNRNLLELAQIGLEAHIWLRSLSTVLPILRRLYGLAAGADSRAKSMAVGSSAGLSAQADVWLSHLQAWGKENGELQQEIANMTLTAQRLRTICNAFTKAARGEELPPMDDMGF